MLNLQNFGVGGMKAGTVIDGQFPGHDCNACLESLDAAISVQ